MIEIYCDESRQDLLTTSLKKHDQYTLIGSLWVDPDTRRRLTKQMNKLRSEYGVFGEIKWSKVLTPSKIYLFHELVNLFFDYPGIEFRCICIDSYLIDNTYYNDGDGELGFYKFYYQTLFHWIGNDTYRVYCDMKLNQNRNRLKVLHRILIKKTAGTIEFIRPLSSSDTPMLQLCDFILGLTSAKINNSVNTESLKGDLIKKFEHRLGNPIRPTSKYTKKFNVFYIDLKCREGHSE